MCVYRPSYGNIGHKAQTYFSFPHRLTIILCLDRFCIASCSAVRPHIPAPSIYPVPPRSTIPSPSRVLYLLAHPAVSRSRFPATAKGYAGELSQTVIILNSVNPAPAPRQPSRPYFLNAACTAPPSGCKLLRALR